MRVQPIYVTARRLRTLKFIEDNIHRHITLAELADVCALSPFHFTRRFHTAMGMTPTNYISTRRVARAKVLLTAGATSMADVAYACGFSSQSHFCTVFKAVTGMTPTDHQERTY